MKDMQTEKKSKTGNEINLRKKKTSFVYGNSSDEEPEEEMNSEDEAAIDDSLIGRDNFNYASVRNKIQGQDDDEIINDFTKVLRAFDSRPRRHKFREPPKKKRTRHSNVFKQKAHQLHDQGLTLMEIKDFF